MAKKKSSTKSKAGSTNNATSSGDGILVDPARVRFQHARIRPFFSGCGRSVEETLNEIRQGKLDPADLPPIQVLVGPVEKETGLHWYFSLNNRRLWVLKRCREEGLLPNNQIYVRVRKPKSDQEARRYTVENCALDAKIMPEKPRGRDPSTDNDLVDQENGGTHIETDHGSHDPQATDKKDDSKGVEDEGSSDQDSDSSDDECAGPANRFSALF